MSILPTQSGIYYRQEIDPYWANVRALYHFDGPINVLNQQAVSTSPVVNAALINPYPALTNPGGTLEYRTDRVKWGYSSIVYRTLGFHITTIPALGTQDFTIEYWFSRNATSSGEVFAMMSVGQGGVGGGFHLRVESNRITLWNGADTANAILSSPATFGNTNWNHLAVSRVSGVTRMYLNGVQAGTPTTPSTPATTTAVGNLTATDLVIGAYNTSGSTLKGNIYMEEFRMTVGVGRYAAGSFTLPDFPYAMPAPPAFSNTTFAAPGGSTVSWSLDVISPVGKTLTYSVQSGTLPGTLALNTSTGVISGNLPTAQTYDSSSTVTIRASDGYAYADQVITITNQGVDTNYSNVIVHMPFDTAAGSTPVEISSGRVPVPLASGSGTISATRSKWATTAMNPSSNNWTMLPNDGSLTMSGDFTFEGWFYPTANAAYSTFFASYNTSITANDVIFHTNASGVLSLYVSGTPYTLTGTVSLNNWHHIAWTRQGTTNRFYLDGTLTTTNTLYTGTVGEGGIQNITIGGYQTSSTSNYNGSISDVRITKDLARYTGSTLTVPTGPFAKYSTAIQSPQWVTAAGSIGNAAVGKVFNYALKAITSNGSGTISYAVQSGALPAGVTLNTSTGMISGTPSVSILTDTTYSFTIRATLGSVTSDRAFTMVVFNDDPLYSNVFTAFQFIGANGAAPTENSGKSTFTRSNATLSTAQFKWATSSAFLNGTSNFYTVTPTTTGQFNGDFTIETWIRPTTAGTTSSTGYFFSAAAATNDIHSLNIGLVGNNMTANWLGGSLTSTGNLVTYNNWHHLAAVRQNGVLTLYVNGVSVASGAYTGQPTTSASPFTYTIGCLKSATATYNLNAYLNDYRVTFGARYTGSSFTVPTFQIPLH